MRNNMKREIQEALEAIGKSGIIVNGDLVLEKKVDYEVNNVENGGIGIQIVNGNEPKTVIVKNDCNKNKETVMSEDSQSKNENKLNYVAPKLALQEILKGSWIDSVVVDKNKYSYIWRQTMVEALMKSELAKDIATEWADEGKRLQVKFAFVGAIKDVGVLNSSYNALASKFDVPNVDAASLAKYMGYGKRKSYFEWLKQYVNKG